MPVVGRQHFTQLLGELVRLVPGIGVMLTGLVVSDSEPGAAAIAKLESLDRIRRIFRNFFVENRDWSV